MKNKAIGREKIPSHIKREVRQRCGFGCVICGLPLYEYEHMEEWAVVKRHVADEITLLCDRHHREKTAHLLPKEDVRKFNKNPINLQNEKSKKYNLHFSGSRAEVWVGSNSFVCENLEDGAELNAIVVDGFPLIQMKVQDKHLLLNLTFFDEQNKIAAQIVENELVYSTSPWDIELIGTNLTIREGHGIILLNIEFSPPNKIKINSGRLLRNGIELLIKPTKVIITNNQITIEQNRSINCNAGLILGKSHPSKTYSGFFKLTNTPRYIDRYKGPTISETDWIIEKERNNKMKFENQEFIHETIELDYNAYKDCSFTNCTLFYRGLTGIVLQGCKINDCNWQFLDNANNTLIALSVLHKLFDDNGHPLVEGTFEGIRNGAFLIPPQQN